MKALAILLLTTTALHAQTYPQATSETVNDFADLLSADQEARLGEVLSKLKTESDVELLVVTVGSRAEWGESASLAEAATGLFNAWGIGDATRGDGILFVVASEDREMQITLGEGYPATYDWLTADIVESQILPYLSSDRLPEGIQAGTLAIRDRIALPFAEGRAPEVQPVAASQPAPGDPAPAWPWLAGIGVLIAGLFGFAKLARARQQCPDCGKRGRITRTSEVLNEASADKGGLVRITDTCGWCKTSHRREEITPRLAPKVALGGGKSKGGGSGGNW
jgi:uncharacterized protein